jgi:hypothetical protein
MNKIMFRIENSLASLPNDTAERATYLAKAKAYGTECGCAWGARFLLVSLGIFIASLFLSRDADVAGSMANIVWGIVFVFASSAAGKLIGIGIARIKLALLYRDLVATYGNLGE